MARRTNIKTSTARGWWKWIAVVLGIVVALVVAKVATHTKSVRGGAISSPSLNQPVNSCEALAVASVPRTIVSEDPSMILKDLMLSHPDREIREDMFRLIDERVLSLNLQDHGLGGGVTIALFMVLHIEGKGITPLMNISLRAMHDPQTPKPLLQLIVLHEYVHYLQYKEFVSQYGEESASKEFGPLRVTDSLSDEVVRVWFKREIEAYDRECTFAVAQGWECFLDFCGEYKKTGLAGLKRVLHAKFLSTGLPYVPALRKLKDELLR